MEVDEKAGGGESSSRVMPTFIKSGNRQLFTVELRPGDTTIVSWKKLLKDANKVNSGSGSASVAAALAAPPIAMQSALEPRAVQSQSAEPEPKDAAQPNRYSAVIEKIERLYMGKDSSDDEDLNDIPDDDQYDTEDSFIDDAELDEYFQVDKATVKHDGFYVNRGKLECINEAAAQPNQQQKKRRRKDLCKGNDEKDDGTMPSKHIKMGKNATRKVAPQSVSIMAEPYDVGRFPNQIDISGSGSKKKSADDRVMLGFSSSSKAANGDVPTAFAENRSAEKQNKGVTQARNVTSKVKGSSGSLDSMHQKYHDRSSLSQSKSLLDSSGEIESSKRPRQKHGLQEVPDLNMLDSKHAEASRTVHANRKDGSAVRPKGSLLEKAIRDLERMVAESRPPTTDNQEGDNSSQSVKRRLPSEIKLKLAKVARLAQSSHGKISKELVTRLDSILGHLIQLRTLKRNLKIMVNMSLSAKQEKESRFQQIKKEVTDMVRTGVQSLESKVLEQQAGASDDFQDYRGADRRKYQMDAAVEDKICDLYDLYVDVMDEEAGPQVRKLYTELAGLWPNALMDNHGIKRAICRAKERKKSLYNKHKAEEKIQRKKLLIPKPEPVTVRAESGSVVAHPQPQPNTGTDRLIASEITANVFTSGNKTIPARVPGPLSVPTTERAKNDKGKGGITRHSGDEVRLSEANAATTTTAAATIIAMKKAKGKPEVDLNEMPMVEKLPSQYGELNKKPKQITTSSGVHKVDPSAAL